MNTGSSVNRDGAQCVDTRAIGGTDVAYTQAQPVVPDHAADLQRLVNFFENLSPQALSHLSTVYADDAIFKDPFNEVRGVPAITLIFEHMFDQVDAPRFVVASRIAQGNEAFLTWEFRFRMKRFSRAAQCIRGATHIRFNDDGLATLHRDYWDAAEELYEKLPLLGSFMRWLKRTSAK